MSKKVFWLCGLGLGAIVTISTGCTLGGGLKNGCQVVGDCNSGRTCVNGTCSPITSVPGDDGGQPPDAGESVAMCSAADGPLHPYTGGSELLALLRGPWALCSGNDIARKGAAGIEFSDDGTKWYSLSLDSAGNLVRATGFDSGGTVEIVNNKQVNLNGSSAGFVEFEDGPRKMRFNNTGGYAYYAAGSKVVVPVEYGHCSDPDGAVLSVTSLAEEASLLQGKWLFCDGTGMVFGPSGSVGVELTANAWYALQYDNKGQLVRGTGFDNSGVLELRDTTVFNGPGSYQIDLKTVSNGTFVMHATFEDHPRKMRYKSGDGPTPPNPGGTYVLVP